MVATVISVMVMIVTLSLANGFQKAVSEKVFSFWGHVRIQEKQPEKAIISEEIPIQKNETLEARIRQDPEVRGIHPFATKYAILKTKEDIEGVLFKGYDTAYDPGHIRQFIREGRFILFNDSSYSREILISQHTARQLQLKLNDRVLIYFIRPDGTIRPDKLTIAGIYKTGIEEYDKTFAVGDLKLIQRLNRDTVDNVWDENAVGGYEIFLNDYRNTEAVLHRIYELEDFPPTWNTLSVRNISPNIFDWLNMQDVTRDVLIGFMVAVAVINLITCLIVLVLERIRMIGILKAVGASDWTVQKIFLRHSLWITLTGIVGGTLLALGFLYLQETTGFIKLKEEAYYMSQAAVDIVWWQIALVCAGTLVVCLLVLMIPSFLVRKVQPVRAIHFR